MLPFSSHTHLHNFWNKIRHASEDHQRYVTLQIWPVRLRELIAELSVLCIHSARDPGNVFLVLYLKGGENPRVNTVATLHQCACACV